MKIRVKREMLIEFNELILLWYLGTSSKQRKYFHVQKFKFYAE